VRPPPGSGWLLLRRTLAAADMIGVFLWIGGLRNGHAVASFDLWHLTGTTLTALAAGIAAFLFAAPGRDLRPAWLIVPAGALWAGHLGCALPAMAPPSAPIMWRPSERSRPRPVPA
jgi:hypothetical protein